MGIEMVTTFDQETENPIEVKIHGETYPVGDPTRLGKYANVSFESIQVGDQWQTLRPIDRYVGENQIKSIPKDTIFTVVSKQAEMHRDDQARYTIQMQSEHGIMGWTLLALNTEILVRDIQQIPIERECTDCKRTFEIDLTSTWQRTHWTKCVHCAWR